MTGGGPAHDRFWLEVAVVRVARWLGSLQIAVVLLLLFAVVLFLGTLMESWYDGKVAQQLIYQTWWFTLLLAFLSVNIFFAAAKKWPWKKHQTGFLITHAGLLTMLAGGILNSLGGTDAMMVVVDSDGPQARRFGEHTSRHIVDRGLARITVRRPHKNKDDARSYPFEPGPAQWKPDQYLRPRVDTLAGLLAWLAHPLPHTWQADLGDGATLEVLGFYPTVREEAFGPAPDDQVNAFPAVKFQLASPRLIERGRQGVLPDDWVAGEAEDRTRSVGPGRVEMLGRECSPEMLLEFRNPPPPDKVGKKGQLVVFLSGRPYRFDVDSTLNRPPQPLGDTGWSLQIQRYSPDWHEDAETRPTNPALLLELTGPDGKRSGFATTARAAGELVPASADPDLRRRLKDLRVWYHPPDHRFGDPSVRAVLQFVAGADGKLYYRSFHTAGEVFGFEKAGEIAKGGKRQPIWGSMNWKLRVVEFLPRAVAGPCFIPVDRRLGLEDEELSPAIRCRLVTPKETRELWVPKTEGRSIPVTVGGEPFSVGYHPYARDLDFEITLQRAEQTNDKGTQQAATYSSYVLLTDPREGIEGEPRVITMNQPLEHGGYKFYQSGYLSLGMDENEKPVNRSVFTVAADPGMWLKYAGSTMLALGIACMFYMKAYFFKPRRRPSLAAGASTQGD
jgi:hypothetical protein